MIHQSEVLRKTLLIGVIILFIGVGFQPALATVQNNSTPIRNGNTLYVGGSGPGNYSKIQDAIDNSSDNDTIIVFYGIYYERIKIDKKIYLKGISSESQHSQKPIIDAQKKGKVVKLNAEGCTIDGFWLRNSGTTWSDWACVHVNNKYCVIKNNKMSGDCRGGIYIEAFDVADWTWIINNTIIGTGFYGIEMPRVSPGFYSDYINITGNTITKCDEGILLHGVDYLSVYNNNISSNRYGILPVWGSRHKIINNTVSNNEDFGIRLYEVWNGTVSQNTVFSNGWSGIDLWLAFEHACHEVTDNVIYSNVRNGIHLDGANNCRISRNIIYNNGWSGIDCDSESNILVENYVTNNSKHGIYINDEKNEVNGNIIEGNGKSGIQILSQGVDEVNNQRNLVINNIISNNENGIKVSNSDYNTISNNNILNNSDGIHFIKVKNNILTGNNVYNNKNSTFLEKCKFNIISKNNFIGNEPLATFEDSYLNFWRRNFWNEPLDSPYAIPGFIWKGRMSWKNYDWRPAKKPYDVIV